ncbi:Di-copper centre-containing protein, partial [Neoconidiobolus thromboides FSU 785]
RKEIRELTQDELTRFVRAAKKLQSTKAGSGNLTIYDNYSKIHYNAQGNAHGTPKFLPWHRYYIRLYEKELQKIDSSVHLPYWDWSKDYDYPANSAVLSNSYMGANGDRSRNYCLNSGKFSGLYVNYPKLHCLQRRYDQGSSVSSFTPPSILNSFLNYDKFSEFCGNLEEKHGDPHVKIGGGYDFRQMYSPNDPLFMLHHTFIDMLWYEWQQRHPD